ncbi:MAG: acyltransferase [Tannerellaceae bacterium]|jgi:predicted LPLAT superfamily acyltransferase|nr:acyltransferase [Tannerellaceae bacterium]
MNQNKQGDWKGHTRGGTFGYGFFILLIRLLGIKVAYAFLCLVVVYFIPFAPKATCATWRYARNILHYGYFRSVGFLFLNYYRLGQTLIDKVAIGLGQVHSYHFDFGENYEDFLDILNGQQGVILIGAHVGNWEIGAPFFNDYGKKMNIVMFDAEYQKIKDLLAKHRDESHYKVIPVNEDNLTHVFRISDALNRNEYVCFQGDRFAKGTQTLSAFFMGKEAFFPAGPYLLASRLDVPVIFYFAMREKGMRYSFNFVLAEPVEKGKGKKPEEAILGQYIKALETIIRNYPEQWFNYYDFWKQHKQV